MRLTAPRNRPAAAKISRKTGQGKGRRQAARAAPQVVEAEGDLVPLRGLQQALAAGAGEVEAAEDQAAVLAEEGEGAHPEGEEAVAGEQAADQVAPLVQNGLEPEGEDQADQGGQGEGQAVEVQGPHEGIAPRCPQKGGGNKDGQLLPGDGVPLQTISPFCYETSKKYKWERKFHPSVQSA